MLSLVVRLATVQEFKPQARRNTKPVCPSYSLPRVPKNPTNRNRGPIPFFPCTIFQASRLFEHFNFSKVNGGSPPKPREDHRKKPPNARQRTVTPGRRGPPPELRSNYELLPQHL
ncbi:hypothetical protein HNY73_011738 [Argiope bruennichi]|uniref:Uncharacterized protein n=1 Tax=Argiope bruennichi TaxID=94029 RepID=A0A8T0F0N5_ARGBR|nr:hypothetical protein HNY73_011738 [Argiope bruennichi]